MSFKQLLLSVGLWRLVITLAAIPAIFILPLKPGFTQLTAGLSLSNIYQMWANFDGIHYFNLAKYGYASFYTGYLQAFFPVFPLIISWLGQVVGDYLTAGYLITHLSLVLALWYFYRLVSLDWSPAISRETLKLLLIFPSAFFLVSLYSESLFLLLVVSCFYYARRQHWLTACLIAAVASATRVAGVFLWLPLVIEFSAAHQNNLKHIGSDRHFLWLILPPAGLFLYMNYLQQTTGDPFFFANIQPLFGAQREVGHLILLYQVFFRYFKMLIFIDHTDPLFFTVLLEFLSGSLFLVLSILAFKFSRLSYALYMLPSYILPTLTGTFSSVPRYVLVLFPGFILLARWLKKQSPSIRLVYYVVSALLSLFSLSLFTRGYFVG